MDGDYYAIKGFEYQIDKTLLKILNTKEDDRKINIENIQDIDSNDFVMQIKYKETQSYPSNKIKEPVLQLIEEFKNNPH